MTPPGGVDDLRSWKAERAAPARAGAGDGLDQVRATDAAGVEHPPPPPNDGGSGSGDDAGAPIELIDPKNPLEISKRFVARLFTESPWRLLHHWRADFYAFRDGAWGLMDDQEIRNSLYLWLATTRKRAKEGTTAPCPPNARFVGNVVDALKAAVPLRSTIEPPCWFPTDDAAAAAWIAEQPPAAEFLAVANGLLHIGDDLLSPPTPAFFPISVSPVRFDYGARTPFAWLEFLQSMWPNDPQSIETLAEIFGYLLTGATDQQKMFLLVGPPRSGKGTIAKILTALIGAHSVVSPSFAKLGDAFALEPLIGKSVAIIGDARVGRQSDQAAIVENLLGISGEDDRTVSRKHQPSWTGRLRTRFLLISNELPALGDASGAFASRIILLTLSTSFLGREDAALSGRLMGELPAILNWALDGWRRLQKRVRFAQPESARDALGTLRDLGSEIHGFIRDRCQIGADMIVGTDELFAGYEEWRKSVGYDGKISHVSFGKKLRAALPSVKNTQPRDGTGRLRMYAGIALRGDNPNLPLETERT